MSKEEKPSLQNVTVGNRSVVIGGNVTGSTIMTGDGNVQQGATVEEFRSLLAELREAIRTSELDADTKRRLEKRAENVEDEVQSAAPSKPDVIGDLTTMANVLEKAATLGEKLAPMAAKLVPWASALF